MEGRTEVLWTDAWRQARRFLARWGDLPTRNERDDIAQESAFLAIGQIDRVRDIAAFPAIVRTIARRVRSKALEQLLGCEGSRSGGDPDDLPRADGHDGWFVCGVLVDRLWLLAQLDAVLARLDVLSRQLLLAFHEGFCCAEIAARFRLPPQSVKVRLYRTRCRVRIELEAAVRAADRVGHLQPLDEKEGGRG